MNLRAPFATGLVAVTLLQGACGGSNEDPIVSKSASKAAAPATPPAPAAPAPAPAAVTPAPSASGATAPAVPAVREFQEADFIESERSRDPFRNFSKLFVEKDVGPKTSQRAVLMDRYGLDQFKLVGVISGSGARALLIDPTGLGWSVKVGDYIGHSELVHVPGTSGADVAMNWRVDRIREEDLVLVREDAAHPEVAPTTKVIPLHADGDTLGLGLAQ